MRRLGGGAAAAEKRFQQTKSQTFDRRTDLPNFRPAQDQAVQCLPGLHEKNSITPGFLPVDFPNP